MQLHQLRDHDSTYCACANLMYVRVLDTLDGNASDLVNRQEPSLTKKIPWILRARAFLGGSAPSPLVPTNHAVGFGPIQPTKRAIKDASLLEQGGTEALQLDENV